jgi:two-component system sensor histidine kinase ResE
MIHLVEELLAINKIESGRISYEFEVLSLENLFRHVVSAFEGAFPTKPLIAKFQFDKRSQPKIVGDWKKLTQVCMNILNNAVKYSDQDTPIYFMISKKQEEYILEITDQGQGIDSEDLPRIFEGFYKGKDAPSGSMGVGLYLAREIVTAHRGVIDVDSVLGKGTSVFVRLPRYTL